MGRKKIQISRITDERNRQVTFNKRKFGVMKKAYELSVLCDCEIALIIFSSSNKLYQYASTDMDKVLLKYTEYNEPHESLTNKNIIEQLNKKELKGGALSPESPDESCDGTQGPYQLTPRTEAKYSKIDEEFQLLMQHQRMARNNVGANYSLPTMSVNNMYESGNLQLQHNASPRPPSSSDADSVYPPGSMLEMSNGYQASSSPALVNSPSSPGQLVMSPSPTPKALNASNRATPPPRHHSPRPNLRIVMPNTPSHHEDNNTNNTINTPTVSLNTPVVALHTPGLGGSYHGIFTDLNSSDMGLSSALNWSNQIAHNSGMSHLAVPNSSPPPSSPSPNSVRIKSEPNSPPHLHHHTSSATSGTAPHNTVVSHSISHLSLPHAHSAHTSIPSHHLSVTERFILGGQMPNNQNLVDSRHDFEGGPPPKRLRDTWPT